MSIINTTLNFFGNELGQHLLDNRLIITAFDKHPTAPYKNGFEGSYEGNAQQIGFLTGEQSGIIVVDFDDAERYSYLADVADVRTQRGFHIYCKYDSRFARALSPKDSKIDILSGNKPCYFAGANRDWNLKDLADIDDVLLALEQHGDALSLTTSEREEDALSLRIGSSIDYRIDYSTSNTMNVDLDSFKAKLQTRQDRYIGLVQQAKFGQFTVELNLSHIENNLVGKMKATPLGARNNRLFRYAIEFARCELNTDRLEDAAVAGGQERREVRATIDEACEAYQEDHGVSVLDRVRIWHEYASYGCATQNQQAAVDWIAAHAVAQNDYRPLVSQLGLANEIGARQRGLSKTFVHALPTKGLVIVHQQPGQQANGNKHCHNYELALDSVPVSQMTEQLDQLVAQSKSKPLEPSPVVQEPEVIADAPEEVSVMDLDDVIAICGTHNEVEEITITEEEKKEYSLNWSTMPIETWVKNRRENTPDW